MEILRTKFSALISCATHRKMFTFEKLDNKTIVSMSFFSLIQGDKRFFFLQKQMSITAQFLELQQISCDVACGNK